MGNSFIKTLISTFRGKIVPLLTKIRFIFTVQFWRTKVFTKFREIFSKIFNVRPVDKDDYYSVGRYLVSKKLAYAIVMVIGVLSLVYLIAIRGVLIPTEEGIKSYKYNSVLLRFTTNNKVIIKGKSGYKAYEGAVSKGSVTGKGLLYNKNGDLIYQGSFENNKYNGNGNSYYDNGNMQYSGEFVENYFDGKGKLYRKNGVVYYDGEFSRGMKNGVGTLYNAQGEDVYTGTFEQDNLVYSELLGKSVSEVREYYTGDWEAYEAEDEYCVYMKDIDAIYEGESVEDSVEEEMSVKSVYILSDTFKLAGKEYTNIADIESVFGEALYHGNSMAILPEAVAVKVISGYKSVLNGPVTIDYTQEYKEYTRINAFDNNYKLYLYSYDYEGTLYTFFCRDNNSGFAFYSVMPSGTGEQEGE